MYYQGSIGCHGTGFKVESKTALDIKILREYEVKTLKRCILQK